MKKSVRNIAFVTALALVYPQLACPWAWRGHEVIDAAAVDGLPADGPLFLKKYRDYISHSASVPDNWRDENGLFSRIEEDPNHGWFKERLDFMHGNYPRSRYEFVIELYKHYEVIKRTDPEAANYMNVRWTGTLPYAAVETYERMVDEMRRIHTLQKAGQDTSDLEQTVAFLVYWMGHYIGDGSQPLHDTVNANGWRLPTNPNGYTTGTNIHEDFENVLVNNMKLSEQDLLTRMPPPGHLHGDVFDNIIAFLDKSASRQEDIYKLDKAGVLKDASNAKSRDMVYTCATDGASMLRDLIYRAWLESAQPNPNADKSPVSIKNPRYNPETGSAPATRSPELLNLPKDVK
ncbi:MAG: nuclease [Acidobacteriota bacterium]